MEENKNMIPVEETKEKKTFKEKASAFWTKNRKKIVVGTSALAAIGAAMVVGKKKAASDACDCEESADETCDVPAESDPSEE